MLLLEKGAYEGMDACLMYAKSFQLTLPYANLIHTGATLYLARVIQST